MNLTLSDLVSASAGQLVFGRPADPIRRVSIDTRTLQKGDTFFAIQGPHFDGHDFLRSAVERGAATVVLSDLDARAEFPASRTPAVVQVPDTRMALQKLAGLARTRLTGTVIAITGSNGKTTTKEITASILRLVGTTAATRGNLNNHIGLPLTLCELPEDLRYAVLELGTSKPGDMDLLMDLARPHIGLITNVGKDHLEFVGTPEGMLEVNRPLIDRLPGGGTAIINLDDPLLAPLAKSFKGKIVTYGFHPEAQVRAESVRPWPLPMTFTLCIQGKRVSARLPVPGRMQVLNALAAAAVAHALDIHLDHIVEGLRTFKPAAMRMQVHEREDGAILINDAYNANPTSMRAAIESFCETYPDRPRWLVLGDMRELGTASRDEHEALGRWLARQPVQKVYLYGRDTRHVAASAQSSGSVSVERFRKKRYLVDALKPRIAAEHPVILFKASRSLKLEDVVSALS